MSIIEYNYEEYIALLYKVTHTKTLGQLEAWVFRVRDLVYAHSIEGDHVDGDDPAVVLNYVLQRLEDAARYRHMWRDSSEWIELTHAIIDLCDRGDRGFVGRVARVFGYHLVRADEEKRLYGAFVRFTQ